MAAANKLLVPPLLLLSVCHVESGFTNTVNEYNTAHGVCQIKLETARYMIPHLDLLSLRQPSVNVYVSGMYLKYQYDRYGAWDKAVVAYNAGGVYYNDTDGEYSNKWYLNKVSVKYRYYQSKYKKALSIVSSEI